MATVQDVAAAILKTTGAIDTFKLQKLTYYSQAWHLVWDEHPLFTEDFQAWANGPVCRELYEHHRGRYTVVDWPWGDAGNLNDSEAETVQAIVDSYGHLSGRQLSHLTHQEAPWVDARRGLSPGARASVVIDKDAMFDYYSSIEDDAFSQDVAAYAASAED